MAVSKPKASRQLRQEVGGFVSRHPLGVTLGAVFGLIASVFAAATFGFTVGQDNAEQRIATLEALLEQAKAECAKLQQKPEKTKENPSSPLPVPSGGNKSLVGAPSPKPPKPPPVQGIGCGKISGFVLRLCVGKGPWTDASGAIRISLDRIETSGSPDRGVLYVKDAAGDRRPQLHEWQTLDVKRRDGKLAKLTLQRVSSAENYVEIDVTELVR